MNLRQTLKIFGVVVGLSSAILVSTVFYTLVFLRVPYTIVLEDRWFNFLELVSVLIGIAGMLIWFVDDIGECKNVRT